MTKKNTQAKKRGAMKPAKKAELNAELDRIGKVIEEAEIKERRRKDEQAEAEVFLRKAQHGMMAKLLEHVRTVQTFAEARRIIERLTLQAQNTPLQRSMQRLMRTVVDVHLEWTEEVKRLAEILDGSRVEAGGPVEAKEPDHG